MFNSTHITNKMSVSICTSGIENKLGEINENISNINRCATLSIYTRDHYKRYYEFYQNGVHEQIIDKLELFCHKKKTDFVSLVNVTYNQCRYIPEQEIEDLYREINEIRTRHFVETDYHYSDDEYDEYCKEAKVTIPLTEFDELRRYKSSYQSTPIYQVKTSGQFAELIIQVLNRMIFSDCNQNGREDFGFYEHLCRTKGYRILRKETIES